MSKDQKIIELIRKYHKIGYEDGEDNDGYETVEESFSGLNMEYAINEFKEVILNSGD